MELIVFNSTFVALPSVHHVYRERVDDLVFWLNNSSWPLIIGLITFLRIRVCNRWRFFILFFRSLLLSFFVFVLLLLLANLFQKLSLLMGDVSVLKQWVGIFRFDCHHLWAWTFTFYVFENFVIARDFLLLLSKYSIDTIEGGVCNELLELSVL